MDIKKASLAWQNILAAKHCNSGDDLLIVSDESKLDLARVLADVAHDMGASPYLLLLPSPPDGTYASWFVDFIGIVVKTQFVVILLSHSMYTAKGIMEIIGRPDRELGEVSSRFFTDWTIPTDSFIRIYSADPAEIKGYQTALIKALSGGNSIKLVTELGTNIRLQVRDWRSHSADEMGEICSAPLETSAEEVLIYDASVCWGQPKSPIKVTVQGGRISRIESLGPEAEQCQWFVSQSKQDDGASVLAELGFGLNPKGDPFSHGMEAEQARGTCHIDFGNSRPFGGSNYSSVHFGGTISKPTVYVDDIMVLDKGDLIAWP